MAEAAPTTPTPNRHAPTTATRTNMGDSTLDTLAPVTRTMLTRFLNRPLTIAAPQLGQFFAADLARFTRSLPQSGRAPAPRRYVCPPQPSQQGRFRSSSRQS